MKNKLFNIIATIATIAVGCVMLSTCGQIDEKEINADVITSANAADNSEDTQQTQAGSDADSDNSSDTAEATQNVQTVQTTQTSDNSSAENNNNNYNASKAQARENMSVQQIVADMTTDEKIAQILLVRYQGDNSEQLMSEYSFGGFTMYAGDFENETPDSVKAEISAVKSAAITTPFIAVDEEGGDIVRVSKFSAFRSEPFPSELTLAQGGSDVIKDNSREKAELLLSLGINFNLAPVADVTDNPDDYIYSRTFGVDAEKTGDFTADVVSVMNDCKIGCCLKHFPGYGTNKNTHTGISVDERSAESFENCDFIPFEKGIAAGVPAVLVSHNIITAYDGNYPASLSPKMHDILRNKLGFDGVIVSDDLGMDAITLYSGEESPYVLAVLAGNDLLCTTDWQTSVKDITAAVESGKITSDRLDESVKRILEMKENLGIIG